MAETPTLFVCHGDDGGPRVHPCRRVQKALRAAGIEYDKVIAAHGNPIPFLRKGSRDELRAATGKTKLPALKLPDGTVITHSRAILSWIRSRSDLAGGMSDMPGPSGQAILQPLERRLRAGRPHACQDPFPPSQSLDGRRSGGAVRRLGR